ncbi:MAG: DJ-1/PfpI family protein [Candidatus Gracilibacteria bacterium]|nr:DJ-1/PfpI family protein [Candidatus Gracilibacteria bacterium]
MAKVLLIIAQKNFQEQEYAHTREKLEAGGHEVMVSSVEKGTCMGKLGREVQSQLSFKEAQANDFDGIVLIGGPGALKLLDYPELLDLIKNFATQDKIVSAICIAPVILAAAGVLSGKRATVFPDPEAQQNLLAAGAQGAFSEELVQDGKLITANGPAAAYAFGEAIAKTLNV